MNKSVLNYQIFIVQNNTTDYEEIKVQDVEHPEDVLSHVQKSKLSQQNNGDASYELQQEKDHPLNQFTGGYQPFIWINIKPFKVISDQHDFLNSHALCRVLGEGSYGKVYCAQEKSEKKLYAIKVLDKYHIMKHSKVENVFRERDLLRSLNHPNIIKQFFTFQDDTNLYYVFEYASKGSLTKLIQRIHTHGKMPIDLIKFYFVQILGALEAMHSKNILHRDLKPENILLTEDWHIKIIDFGDAYKMEDQKEVIQDITKDPGKRKATFVGTPLYVSPEMLQDNISSPAGDIWALGCILFQMITGDVPFKAQHDYQTFQLILERKMTFPSDMDEQTKDFIDQTVINQILKQNSSYKMSQQIQVQMLQVDPLKRIGMLHMNECAQKSFEVIRAHPFLSDVNFEQFVSQAVPMPKAISLIYDKQLTMKRMKKKQDNGGVSPSKEIKEIKRGLLKKRNEYYMKQSRTFILTSEPRLREVPLNRQVYARRSGRDRFELVTPNRTYFLSEAVAGDSDAWITSINNAISEFCPDK